MSTLIKCPACGREVSAKAASCPHCGDPLRQEEQKQSATGVLAAILIALIIGGLLYAMIVSM